MVSQGHGLKSQIGLLWDERGGVVRSGYRGDVLFK